MSIDTTGPADKKAGIVKVRPKAPHPANTDDRFGSKTNYADFSKTNVKIIGRKK